MTADRETRGAKAPVSVAVVIVNYRSAELAVGALDSLIPERSGIDLRAIVVDGGSGDGSADYLAEALRAERFSGWASLLALPINGGFGWANNQAILSLLQAENPPEFIHLMNPDSRCLPGAVTALIDVAVNDASCGAVGSLLIDPDGAPSGSAFRFPSYAREFLRACRMAKLGQLLKIKPVLVTATAAIPVDWVTGASVLFRSEALRQVGLFDDGFFLYFEEVELMWRLHGGGWRIVHEPKSRVVHIGGAATGINMSGRDREVRRPMPPYWYQSRRRFFALTRGRVAASLAGLAWMSGYAASFGRRIIPSMRKPNKVANEFRDLVAHGLFAAKDDDRSSVVAWNSEIGVPPAWMTKHRV